MNTLSKEAETRILDAIQDVCHHVSEGMDPTSAVVKVASEEQLTPNFIKLVCTGYNTGATTYQREKSAGILDKMAEFPLADLPSVMDQMFPDKPVHNSILKEASAVSDEYSRAPKVGRGPSRLREKSASLRDILGEPAEKAGRTIPSEERMKHAYCQALDIKREREVKRAEAAHAQDKLLQGLADLLETVKRGSYDLPALEYAAKARYGEAGTAVFNYIYANAPRLKAAHDGRRLVEVPWDTDIGRKISAVVDAATAAVHYKSAYQRYADFCESKTAKLLDPFELAPAATTIQTTSILSGSSSQPLTKAGFLGSVMNSIGSGIGFNAGQSLRNSTSLSKSPSELASGMAEDLDDPEHDNELRKIQSRTMLQDLMMNDEVISGYDPGEVLDAYNEIVGVTPRSATQAAIVRPLLRKRLTQGAIEPFEAAEMVNIEKGLGEVNKPAPQQAVNKEGSANVLQHRILG